jgi:hypothetical protein
MLKLIKQTFITLGIASGMTAAALMYAHNVPTCRAMVLKDMQANDAFVAQISQPDFLTAMTKGK